MNYDSFAILMKATTASQEEIYSGVVNFNFKV